MNFADASKPSWKERLSATLLSLPVALAVAACTALFGFLASASHGNTKILFLCLLLAISATTALATWLRQSKNGGLKKTANRLARSVAGAGQPVVIALGELCSADNSRESDKKLDSLQRLILETARRNCGTSAVDERRAVLYTFHDGVLEYQMQVGRQDDVPRESFDFNDPLGRSVVEFAQARNGDGKRVDLVGDILRESPRGRIDSHRASFRSFVSTPVAIRRKSFGLIAVDSKTPCEFTELDKGTITLLAGVLAAGLAHYEAHQRLYGTEGVEVR